MQKSIALKNVYVNTCTQWTAAILQMFKISVTKISKLGIAGELTWATCLGYSMKMLTVPFVIYHELLCVKVLCEGVHITM